MQLAFIGTGLMGLPMCERLLKAGHAMPVWNRTRSKAEPLAELGAIITDTPVEAVADADIVFVILERGSAVREVLFEKDVAKAAKSGTLFVDLSSISPAEAREHAAELAKHGHRILDAPVSGGPDGARSAQLAIMLGGDEDDFRMAEPYLNVMGRPTHVGPTGSGQLSKLANQMILSAAMSAVSEALLFVRANGIEPERVIQALKGGYADSRILQNHGRRMIAREFVPGGRADTFNKDLAAAFAAADEHNLNLPFTRLAFERFLELEKMGFGPCDFSAMALLTESKNPGARIGAGADKLP